MYLQMIRGLLKSISKQASQALKAMGNAKPSTLEECGRRNTESPQQHQQACLQIMLTYDAVADGKAMLWPSHWVCVSVPCS
jgi:hypothetical protein